MGRRDRRATASHLIILMLHIIKWKTQTAKRTRSWKRSIDNARREIQRLQDKMPSLNNTLLQAIWQESFHEAREIAEIEMQQATDITSLTWQEVFEDEYNLPFS